MIPNSEETLDILGRKISYKNTKILITPKNKGAED